MTGPQHAALGNSVLQYRIQILYRRHPFWSYPAGLTQAEVPPSVCTPQSPSLFTTQQILYSPSLTYLFAPNLSLAYFAESNVGTGIFIQPHDDTLDGAIKSLICHAGYTGTLCETGKGLGLSKLDTHNIIIQ